MTPLDKTAQSQRESISFEFDLHHSPEKVWRALTDPVNCRILEIEARRKLSHTWGVPFLATVVTFVLTPTALGTRLSLLQSGFKPDQKREFGGARYGWKMMGGKLVDLLARIP